MQIPTKRRKNKEWEGVYCIKIDFINTKLVPCALLHLEKKCNLMASLSVICLLVRKENFMRHTETKTKRYKDTDYLHKTWRTNINVKDIKEFLKDRQGSS